MIIIIGILAAIAIPMFLSQRDKAKEAAVKEGVHSIQIGVQSYAVDNDDAYPAEADVDSPATSPDYRRQLAGQPVGRLPIPWLNVVAMGNYTYAETTPGSH